MAHALVKTVAAVALVAALLAVSLPLGAADQPRLKTEGKAIKPYTLPPEKYRQAVEFNRAHDRLYFVGFAYGIVVYLLVLRWRVAPRLRDWAERISSRRVVQAFLYTPLLLLTLAVLNLPRRAYGHWLLHKFGLSVQGWPSWAWDWFKVLVLTAAFGAFLAWILYGVIRRSPRRWWLYFWLAALPIVVFVVFVEPWVIEPLFFRFEPLAAVRPELVPQIEKVAARAGLRIPPERMFEMKASRKFSAVNAYVTGLGASKRVVVWDTTLEKIGTPGTLVVFGHELGHYVLGHIPEGMALFAVEILLFLFLGFHLLQAMLRRWGPHWALRGADDWASLPAILLLFSVFNFFAAPVENAYSRRIEHQADVYSLEVTHGIVPDSGEVAAETFQIEGEINLEDPHPGPLVRVWLYTHPPIADRMIFAETYDPWSKGRTPQFVK